MSSPLTHILELDRESRTGGGSLPEAVSVHTMENDGIK